MNDIMGPGQPCQVQAAGEDSTPLDLNFAAATPAALERLELTTNTINTSLCPGPQTKASLKLPTTSDDWEQANTHFHTSLVPAVLAVPTPQEMSRLLCEGLSTYFASKYGTNTTHAHKKKRRPLPLKEVQRKKEAKRELRSAKKNGSPVDVVHSLAKHFFSLVRAHGQLKRASRAQLLSRDVRAARLRCHKDFRRCARELLDGKSDQFAQPLVTQLQPVSTSRRCTTQDLGTLSNLSGCHHPPPLTWSWTAVHSLRVRSPKLSRG